MALSVLVLGLAGAVLGGCQNNKEAELTITELRSENEELRVQNDQLESALSACDERYDALAAEREALIAENADLRSAAAAPAASPDTGFASGDGMRVSRRGGDIVVEVAGDVLFSSGKASLRSDAKRRLDEIARVIQQRYASNEIRIAGHTDTDPIRKSGWKTNERLSAERALAVEEYLSSRGISKDRMYAAAYGPAKPRSSKQESRRVEIVIIAAGAS
jgi:outer membrane protein OmpA-like peptidoglycan-associated protein